VEARTLDDATEAGETQTSTGRPRELGRLLGTGEAIGRYVVLGVLGRGGMGTVHAAYDPELDRKVAIKLLHPVADERSDPTIRLRLLREAQAIAKLSHPNVVAVHDVGVHDGRVFVAMEFVDGGTLGQWMRAEPRSWREVTRMFVAAGRGLAAAHAAGIVHRDFKPINVLLGKDGRPRVADFGIARSIDALPNEPPMRLRGELEQTNRSLWSELEDASTNTLTRTGVFLGTPAYMAPEQIEGARVDARADQFGFCVALHEALYGERPFVGGDVHSLYLEIREGRVRDGARGREVPSWLRRVVLRGLAADPAARWPDMPTLLATLEQRPRRSGRAMAGVAVLAFATATGVMVAVPDEPVPPPPLCAGAQAELVSSWSPRLREDVHERVASLDPTLADGLIADLDAWASSWRTSWTDACEATRVHGVQSEALLDRRMSCLARERRRVGAYAELLREADEALLRTSMVGLETLAGPTRCDDAEALMTELAAPEDPQLRAQVEQLTAELDEVHAALIAGEWDRAATTLEPLAAAIEPLGWRPLAAELAFLQGWRAAGVDALELGESAYRRAHVDAIAVGDERLAAASLRDLADLIAEWETRHDEALAHLQVAEAHAEHLDDDDLRASIELTRAVVLEQRGDFEPALAAALRSAEAAARAHGLGSAPLAQARFRASMIAYRLGRIEDAQAALAAARTVWGEHRGPNHPITLDLVNAAGVLAGAAGDWAEAERQFQTLLDRKAAIFGPDHLDVSDALSNLGGAQYNAGHLDAARQSHERALAIRERTMGPDNLYVGHSLANLAIVYARLRRFADADASADRALTIIAAVRGPRHHDSMIAHSLVGEVALAAGDHARAQASYATALELAHEVGSPLQRHEFGLQVSLCLVHRGRFADATTELDAADRGVAGHEVMPFHRLFSEYLRARIAAQTGDLTTARTHAEQVRALVGQFSGIPTADEASRWLAEFDRSQAK
jgi:serine/threonine protein kinase